MIIYGHPIIASEFESYWVPHISDFMLNEIKSLENEYILMNEGYVIFMNFFEVWFNRK